jgi:mono/diheme cytochrome c family protein
LSRVFLSRSRVKDRPSTRGIVDLLLNKGGFLRTASKLFAISSLWFAVFCISTVAWAQSPTDVGATIFKSKCAMCHGPDGAGKTVMGDKLKIRDLRSADVQSQSEAALTQIVSKGKEKMPSYDGKLTKEQIDQVIAYIRELGKKK